MTNFDFRETETVELKRKYIDSIAKEIVAFLNTNACVIYIGVNDDGTICGIEKLDETMRKVSDTITDQISPNAQNYINISALMFDSKWIIKIEVSKGNNLYYIKKYGCIVSGCFERIGTTVKSMTEEQIEERYAKALQIPKPTIVTMESPRFDLTFNEFKMMLVIKKVHFSENSFIENFKLYTPEHKYNYLAFLLSDQNDTSIKVCKFKGLTKAEFISRKEFKEGCLLRQMQEAFDYADNIINSIFTNFSNGKDRVDYRLFDTECFREAWFNAVCHNLWVEKIPPAIYGFDNRVEIISQGTLREDFYNGVSKPVNKELADIMIKLRFMEQSGKGMSLIVNHYGKKVYYFGTSFMQCVFPYSNKIPQKKLQKLLKQQEVLFKESTTQENEDKQTLILKFLKQKPAATRKEIAKQVHLSEDGVKYNLDVLKKLNKIRHTGSTKKGKWELYNEI